VAGIYLLAHAEFIAGHPGNRLRRRHHRPVPVRHHAPQSPGQPEEVSKLPFLGQKFFGTVRPAFTAFALGLRLRPVRCPRQGRGAGDRQYRIPLPGASLPINLLPFEVTSVLLLIAIVGAWSWPNPGSNEPLGRIGMVVPLHYYLALSVALFTLGVIGVLSRRNEP